MKKVIVLALLVGIGAIPTLSKAFTVEEIQSVIKETVDSPSLTALDTDLDVASTTTSTTTSTSTATTTLSASSTPSVTSTSTLLVVPEAKSNEVTLNIVKKTFKKILHFFGF